MLARHAVDTVSAGSRKGPDIPMARDTEEVTEMSNLGEVIERMAIEKQLLEFVRALMETLGVSAERAMELLEVPAEQRAAYLAKL